MTGSVNHNLWTQEDATDATRGTSVGEPWAANDISIDSRSTQPGDLFIALHGPNFDGHDYIQMAYDNGAVAAVVNHNEGLPEGPKVIVENTMVALHNLATAARSRMSGKIIAITGSVGKTGTKEALRHALEEQGKVSATRGNLNNQWGLPLSLARMPKDTDFGIFELGMNHPGEISPLSRLARPHIALITNVEPVHSAHFDTVEQIADAKAEIFDGLAAGGVVVLNSDNANFGRLKLAAETAGVETVIEYGTRERADSRMLKMDLDWQGSDVEASIMGQDLSYRISQSGRHWVMNSLAVLIVAKLVGADVAKAAASLNSLRGLMGRGMRHNLTMEGKSVILIDESYNASPVSVEAALAVLGKATTGKGGRKIAVLGDMLELGDIAEKMHIALSECILEQKIDLVFTAGQYMASLARALPSKLDAGHAMTTQKLLPQIMPAIKDGDVVMVKGSLGSDMKVIVDALLDASVEVSHPENGKGGE